MVPPRTGSGSALSPMLCETASELPTHGDWVFEPKYDGIRVVAYATAKGAKLITRNGNDKSQQFPDVVEALQSLASARGSLVLDGELVALDDGEIARFGKLQGRMHVKDAARIRGHARESPAAFIAFDLLMEGEASLIDEPWRTRRERLEKVLPEEDDPAVIRRGESHEDGAALLKRGEREGWEGIIAKRADAPYRPGRRSQDWLKIKLETTQEFVVGGWTEPRGSRTYLGALLLGYYAEDGKLEYAGHTGTGFDRASLMDMHRRLKPLERKTPPFREKPATNGVAHWVTPKVVVQVRFNEWTHNGTLRQPVFLGVREDKDPGEVVREPTGLRDAKENSRKLAVDENSKSRQIRKNESKKPPSRTRSRKQPAPTLNGETAAVVEQLREMEGSRSGGGSLQLPGGAVLPVTNLGKTFFPETGHTKGDLLRYYAAMWPVIEPWIRDRALVLKRYPNGVAGKAFYQQSAPDQVPAGVRVETLLDDAGEEQARFVGGDLITLLYTIQLGAISFDPWHSRFHLLDEADYTIIDLDPGPGADFSTVVDVARWAKEEMDALGLHGALKTSGSRGLHIYLPLPDGTPLDAATLIAQIVATRVVRKHPEQATIERMTRNRPHGTIYVDYLQNILGKTVAGVYAARARDLATVSTPLAWDELTDDLDPTRFTLETVPPRVAQLGDLWADGMAEPNSLDQFLTAD